MSWRFRRLASAVLRRGLRVAQDRLSIAGYDRRTLVRWSRSARFERLSREMGLTPEEGPLVARLTGPMTSAELAKLTSLPVAEIDRIMAGLAEIGFVDADAL